MSLKTLIQFAQNISLSIKLFIILVTRLKPGFHISQFIGDLLSGIAEGENDFRNTKDFIHR